MRGPPPPRAQRGDHVRVRVPEHKHFRVRDQRFGIRTEDRGDVRNGLFDVAAVRAHEARELHVGIVDLEVESLAQEALGEDDERALAQVVGAGLERESGHADGAPAAREHHLHGALDVLAIAGQDRLQHRQFDVPVLGEIEQRLQILWQAGAAKGEARAQVGGRDVETRVLAQQAHHFA